MNTIFIYPHPDRCVPDPECGDLCPASGRQVKRNAYWLRRLQQGDVSLQPFDQKTHTKELVS